MAIATLKEAALCLEKPTEYANGIVAAGGNFSAHDLRNRTESILPSHTQEIKDFVKKRDTKNKISQEVFDPWLEVDEAHCDDALEAICEVAGLSRKVELGDMLITKPRPLNNTTPLCLAVEGFDSYPKPIENRSANKVNCVLNFDETFGPVLEIATNFKGTPTLAVRVPCYEAETMDGKLAWTPGSVDKFTP